MATEHIFEKNEIIRRFNNIVGKKFIEFDNIGYFEKFKNVKSQKGIAGSDIEQCVLEYPQDNEQKPDLIIVEQDKKTPTEVKTTGILLKEKSKNYVAKEPMSITAVGVDKIHTQTFKTSHFWQKLENMLIVYYLYKFGKNKKPVSAYEYRNFEIKGYEFHNWEEDEKAGLKIDWEIVHKFCSDISSKFNFEKDIKKEFIATSGTLRKELTYIDLAPKFPPRFRLKQSVVSTMVAKYFGDDLIKLPEKYISISDIDKKCDELTKKYKNKTIAEISNELGLNLTNSKNLAEKIIIKMFGADAKHLNQIELFVKFGITAKSITLTSLGARTEDMKLFHIDFNEFMEDTKFEDSQIYNYFTNNEFLYIIFEEPKKAKNQKYELFENKFIGFERIVFSNDFIYNIVYKAWKDTKDKITNKTLLDIPNFDKNGKPKILGDGSKSCAPNFIKSSQNEVFIRGGGINSHLKNKTEVVNNIKMLPQFVWIKGSYIANEIQKNLKDLLC